MEPRTITERDLYIKTGILFALVIGVFILWFAIGTAASQIVDAIERLRSTVNETSAHPRYGMNATPKKIEDCVDTSDGTGNITASDSLDAV